MNIATYDPQFLFLKRNFLKTSEYPNFTHGNNKNKKEKK